MNPEYANEKRSRGCFVLYLLLPIMVLFLGTQFAFAQQDAAQNELERPPEIPAEDAQEAPLPPKIQDEQIEPTVTIRDEEGKRIEEYSRNGQVYMVKVIPEKGVPYYYIDSDGDGRLETSPTKGLEPVRPVYWKIKEWD
jgi:hypothetical protein